MFKKLITYAASALNDPYVLGSIGIFALAKSLNLLMEQAKAVQESLAVIGAQAAAMNGQVPTTEQVPPVNVEEPSEELAE